MKITFLQEAQSEFLDAISCYEAEQPGLGQRFKEEVDRSVLGLPIILSYVACGLADTDA